MPDKTVKKAYQEEYDNFMTSYKRGSCSGEEVGEMIAKMAQHFAGINLLLGTKEVHLNQIAAEKVQSFDSETGKPLSVSKAEILIKATEEWNEYNRTKIDIQNIEQYINGLKYLQRALLNEYAHMGGT